MSADDGDLRPARADEAFDLHRWPFYWLTRTYQQYNRILEASLKTVELDIPRWRVLMLLDGAKPRSVTYLATEAIVKLSTMTRIVQRMQRDGLVETAPSPSDARVTEVKLTPHGRRARLLAWQQADSIFARAMQGVEPDAVDRLNGTLRRILTNLEEPSADDDPAGHNQATYIRAIALSAHS